MCRGDDREGSVRAAVVDEQDLPGFAAANLVQDRGDALDEGEDGFFLVFHRNDNRQHRDNRRRSLTASLAHRCASNVELLISHVASSLGRNGKSEWFTTPLPLAAKDSRDTGTGRVHGTRGVRPDGRAGSG